MVNWRPAWASGGRARIKERGKGERRKRTGWKEVKLAGCVCSLLPAVGRGWVWEEATCSHQRTAPTGPRTLIRSNPDGLCFSFQCLVTCGKGHKHRQVWCQFGEDRLSDRMCDPEAKPEPMQMCQQPECAAWQAGPWGQVFWMIRFLTAFFPPLSGEGHSSGEVLRPCTVWLGLRRTSVAPGPAHGTQQPAVLQPFQGYLALLELITPVTTPRAGFHPVLNCTQVFKQIHNRHGIWQMWSSLEWTSVGMWSCQPADLDQRGLGWALEGIFWLPVRGIQNSPLS